jgi:bacterioferritin B
MMISANMNAALNEQIGNEFSAFLQYVAIAAHFDSESLPELAAYFYRQADEERTHAMRIVKFVVDAGAKVEIPTASAHKSRFASPEDAVRTAYDGEMEVTRQINGLVALAIKESDYITQAILQWFVTEQLEEVSSMDALLKIVQRAGDDLLHVEEYLARRRNLAGSPANATQGG